MNTSLHIKQKVFNKAVCSAEVRYKSENNTSKSPLLDKSYGVYRLRLLQLAMIKDSSFRESLISENVGKEKLLEIHITAKASYKSCGISLLFLSLSLPKGEFD